MEIPRTAASQLQTPTPSSTRCVAGRPGMWPRGIHTPCRCCNWRRWRPGCRQAPSRRRAAVAAAAPPADVGHPPPPHCLHTSPPHARVCRKSLPLGLSSWLRRSSTGSGRALTPLWPTRSCTPRCAAHNTHTHTHTHTHTGGHARLVRCTPLFRLHMACLAAQLSPCCASCLQCAVALMLWYIDARLLAYFALLALGGWVTGGGVLAEPLHARLAVSSRMPVGNRREIPQRLLTTRVCVLTAPKTPRRTPFDAGTCSQLPAVPAALVPRPHPRRAPHPRRLPGPRGRRAARRRLAGAAGGGGGLWVCACPLSSGWLCCFHRIGTKVVLTCPPPDPHPALAQVEFFAPWAPACVHLEPVVAALSLTYTTDRLRFAKVDASRCVCAGAAGAAVAAVASPTGHLVGVGWNVVGSFCAEAHTCSLFCFCPADWPTLPCRGFAGGLSWRQPTECTCTATRPRHCPRLRCSRLARSWGGSLVRWGGGAVGGWVVGGGGDAVVFSLEEARQWQSGADHC